MFEFLEKKLAKNWSFKQIGNKYGPDMQVSHKEKNIVLNVEHKNTIVLKKTNSDQNGLFLGPPK